MMIGSGLGVVMIIIMVVVYVFILVVAWRFMRAHEAIAESIKSITVNFKKEP